MTRIHARTLIRNAIVEKLTGATAANGRVFASRIAAVNVNDPEELPAVMVYLRDEQRDPTKDYGIDAEDSWVRAEVRVIVEAIVKGGSTVDDSLDVMAVQIEDALEDWEIPGFEGATIRLGGSEVDVIQGQKYPVGAIGLLWHIWYERDWRARPPGTRPDTVDVRVNSGSSERIITHDRGIYQAQPETDADLEENEGRPFLPAGRTS